MYTNCILLCVQDVHRCDRYHWYFTDSNLKKLRNIMCTYVWKNLDVGYVQGMCDLVAPLLVIFDDGKTLSSAFLVEIHKLLMFEVHNISLFEVD